MVWEREYVFVKTSRLVCMCVCAFLPGLAVCVSDVNSVLSARFSTLPAAVKRARPSLPPLGLISFFILSAIQLDFLWGHRGQGPFTKSDEPVDCVCVCVCTLFFPENTRRMCNNGYILLAKKKHCLFPDMKIQNENKVQGAGRSTPHENKSADFNYVRTKHLASPTFVFSLSTFSLSILTS